jgi:glycosyltransferase involved in cell wall biosynthesis
MEKKPKIAIMSLNWGVSAGCRNIIDIGNHLKRRGWDVAAFCPDTTSDYPLEFDSYDNINRIIDFKPDFVLATFFATAPWAEEISRETGAKCGYVVQHDESISFGDGVKRTYKMHWDFLITISPWLKRFLEGYGHTNIGMFMPGIDLDIYKPYNNKKPKTVCFYSREMVRKRTDIGVRALEIIKEKRPDIQIHTYDLYDKPKMECRVTHHKGLKNETMAELLSMCTVAMQSTPFEGFGTMSLEPMACGTAVVTPDIKGTEGFDKDTIMYAKLDAEDIADRVIHLIDNDKIRERRVKNGLKFARTVTTERMIDDVESFILKQL